MHEQRRHLRIRLKDVVTYEEEESSKEVPLADQPAWLNNVSESGASMEINHDLASGAVITLQIPLEDEQGEDKTLWIRAIARWSKQMVDTEVYEVGLQFVDLTDADRQILQRFIEEHSEQAI